MGYDFICDNKECKAFNTRLSISGPWPLVEISDLLKLDIVKDKIEMVAGLKARQQEGRRYACAVMPNRGRQTFKGARVQMYCPKDIMIWDEDFEGMSHQETLPTEDRKCRKCNGELITSEIAKKNGLNCPHCQQLMTPHMWFTNE